MTIKENSAIPTVANSLSRTLRFLSAKERFRFFLLVTLRAMTGLLDLLGVVSLGFLATLLPNIASPSSPKIASPSIAGFSLVFVDVWQILVALAGILLLFIVKAAISFSLTGAIATLVARIEARASVRVASKILGGSLEDARSHSREELFFASFAGTAAAFSAQLNALATLISEGFLFVCLTATFLVVDAVSTILVALYFALIAFTIQIAVGKRLQKAATSVRELHLAQDQVLNDLFGSFRELSVAGRRTQYFDNISRLRSAAAADVSKQIRLGTVPRHLVETAVIMGVLALIAVKISTGGLADSTLMLGVFLTGSMRLMAAMLPLQAALISLKQSLPAAQKALALLEDNVVFLEENHKESPSSRSQPRALVGLVFDQVTFKYRGADAAALSRVSFDIQGGQQVAIIGRSGSGKSTIADLICGVLAPTLGKIVIGDGPGSPRVAYVPQRPSAISGSIVDNITLAAPLAELDKDRLDRAVKAASLQDFIKHLPNGLETDMGKHMDGLSGGQLQRLGIARALYQDPDVLVLDEATSSLDSNSEYEVGQTLEALKGSITVVVIAHKLVTVQHSDKVIFLDSGTVKDEGTFSEIVQRNAEVAEAVRLSSFE